MVFSYPDMGTILQIFIYYIYTPTEYSLELCLMDNMLNM
jgi:hypothetical protein